MSKVNIQEIVKQISLPPSFEIRIDTHPEGRKFLQIRQNTICNRTGEPYNEGGRKWDLSDHMTETEIVGTVSFAYQTFMIHEIRESFMYKGIKVYDPHTSITALIEASQVLDER